MPKEAGQLISAAGIFDINKLWKEREVQINPPPFYQV